MIAKQFLTSTNPSFAVLGERLGVRHLEWRSRKLCNQGIIVLNYDDIYMELIPVHCQNVRQIAAQMSEAALSGG